MMVARVDFEELDRRRFAWMSNEIARLSAELREYRSSGLEFSIAGLLTCGIIAFNQWCFGFTSGRTLASIAVVNFIGVLLSGTKRWRRLRKIEADRRADWDGTIPRKVA